MLNPTENADILTLIIRGGLQKSVNDGFSLSWPVVRCRPIVSPPPQLNLGGLDLHQNGKAGVLGKFPKLLGGWPSWGDQK